MIKKFLPVAIVLSLIWQLPAQEAEKPQIKYGVTNLNDKLRTEVTYPMIPSFSINRLDKLSKITDRHKKQHTKTRLDDQSSINIDVYKVKTLAPDVPEVRMARRYETGDGDRPIYVTSSKIILNPLTTKDIYVNRLAGGKLLDTLSVNDLSQCMISRVSPYTIRSLVLSSLRSSMGSYVTGLKIDGISVNSTQLASLDLSKISADRITIDGTALSSISLKDLSLNSSFIKKYGSLTLDINSLGISQMELASLSLLPLSATALGLDSASIGKMDLSKMTLSDLAVQNLIASSHLIAKPTITSLELDPMLSSSLYLNSLVLSSYSISDISSVCSSYSSSSIDDLAIFKVRLSDLSPSDLALTKTKLESLMSKDKMLLPYILVKYGLTADQVKNMSVAEIYKYAFNSRRMEVTDMKLTPQQMTDMSTIYQTLYADFSVPHIVIDNSMFSVVITEDDLQSLQDMTEIYRFSRKFDATPWCLQKLSKLEPDMYKLWMSALISNNTCNISFVKNSKRRRIIGEAKIEHDNPYFTVYQRETLDKNLDIMKSKGYDTVLVRFYADNYTNEVIKVIKAIKAKGYSVFATYVGLDGPWRVKNGEKDWNPFDNTPAEIEASISAISPEVDGWLLNWRGTSFHAMILPAEFYNFICNTVRKYNPTCLIYGEIYYGMIGPTRQVTNPVMVYNTPANITGVLINNMGFYGYNHAYIATKLFAKTVPNFSKYDKIAQVIGYTPYYRSRNNMYFSVDKEYEYKQKIEKNFQSARCSTLTMLHDGTDDGYIDFNEYQTCDSLMMDRSFISAEAYKSYAKPE